MSLHHLFDGHLVHHRMIHGLQRIRLSTGRRNDVASIFRKLEMIVFGGNTSFRETDFEGIVKLRIHLPVRPTTWRKSKTRDSSDGDATTSGIGCRNVRGIREIRIRHCDGRDDAIVSDIGRRVRGRWCAEIESTGANCWWRGGVDGYETGCWCWGVRVALVGCHDGLGALVLITIIHLC